MNSTKEITEAKFLKRYDPSRYERPSTSIDCVIYTILEGELNILLVKRAEHPFKEQWSLVGGYIDLKLDSDLESAAKRKLAEKTGVKAPYLEQLMTIGSRDRDPRGWSVTVVYFALISADSLTLQPGRGALDTKWVKLSDKKATGGLSFDHSELLKLSTKRLQNKVLYTSLPLYLMPKEFTLSNLQRVYEVVLGQSIDPKSFRRRILGAEIIEETGRQNKETKRHAKLYRRIKNSHPHYFVRNIEGCRSRPLNLKANQQFLHGLKTVHE